MQHGSVPPEAANIVQIELMRLHIHSARCHEQHQLDQRVIDHVQERAVNR